MPGADRSGLKVAGIFALIGVVMLSTATYFYRMDQQLIAGGESTGGTVVDFRLERGSRRQGAGRGNDPSNFHHYRVPIIQFTTRAGQVVLFSGPSQGETSEGLKQGEAVEVVYLPAHPETAEVKGSDHYENAALIFTIFGSASLIPGMVMLVPEIRRRRREAHAARYRRKGRSGK